jgi:hypothetical protein
MEGKLNPLHLIAPLLLWVCLGSFVAYAIHDDNVRDAIRLKKTTSEWNSWVAWRDMNCHITEWMVGLSETAGKFHQNDNATVYDCHGIKYVVADSVEYAANHQSLSEEEIPKFDKK